MSDPKLLWLLVKFNLSTALLLTLTTAIFAYSGDRGWTFFTGFGAIAAVFVARMRWKQYCQVLSAAEEANA